MVAVSRRVTAAALLCVVAVGSAPLLRAEPAGFPSPVKLDDNVLEQNKHVVFALTEALAVHDVAKAASYLTDDFVEHNPNIEPGKAGFVTHFSRRWAGQPTPAATFAGGSPLIEAVGEGNIVILMFMSFLTDPVDPAETYSGAQFEAYRVKGGKIAEHWDASSYKGWQPR